MAEWCFIFMAQIVVSFSCLLYQHVIRYVRKPSWAPLSCAGPCCSNASAAMQKDEPRNRLLSGSFMSFVSMAMPHYPDAPCMEYSPTFGWFMGSMLVNIPYMEHMGYEAHMKRHKKPSYRACLPARFELPNSKLVGALEHDFYFSIGNNYHIWLIFFRGVGIPPTSKLVRTNVDECWRPPVPRSHQVCFPASTAACPSECNWMFLGSRWADVDVKEMSCVYCVPFCLIRHTENT